MELFFGRLLDTYMQYSVPQHGRQMACNKTRIHRFALAEFCTTMAHAAHVDVLVAMGLDLGAGMAKMKEWNVGGKSITLRLASKHFCKFLRETKRTVESSKVKTTTKVLGMQSTKETSVVSSITDYYYKVRRRCIDILRFGFSTT